MDETRSADRARRLRAVGTTVGDTAEALGRAESRFVQTFGELVGESTRAISAAAARTVDEVRAGSGTMLDVAGDATARGVEATGQFAGVVLDAGGSFVRELADTATDAVVAGMERRSTPPADVDGVDMPYGVPRVDGPM